MEWSLNPGNKCHSSRLTSIAYQEVNVRSSVCLLSWAAPPIFPARKQEQEVLHKRQHNLSRRLAITGEREGERKKAATAMQGLQDAVATACLLESRGEVRSEDPFDCERQCVRELTISFLESSPLLCHKLTSRASLL